MGKSKRKRPVGAGATMVPMAKPTLDEMLDNLSIVRLGRPDLPLGETYQIILKPFQKPNAQDIFFSQADLLSIARDKQKKTSIDQRAQIGASLFTTTGILIVDTMVMRIKELHDNTEEKEWAKLFTPAAKGRISGYLANVILLNTQSADLNEQMQRPFFREFDYEKAIVGTQWNFPLTGNLFNDLVTNFMYGYVKSMKYEEFLDCVRNLCVNLTSQLTRCIQAAELGFAPVLPVFMEPDFDISSFFNPDALRDTKSNKGQTTNPLLIEAPELALCCGFGTDRVNQIFLDSRFYQGINGVLDFRLKQTFDNSMHKPSKDFKDLIWRGFLNAYTDTNGSTDCYSTSDKKSFVWKRMPSDGENVDSVFYKNLMNDAIIMSKLIERERYDFYRELARMNNKKKTGKFTDKALDTAMAENRKLKLQLAKYTELEQQLREQTDQKNQQAYLEERIRDLQKENASVRRENEKLAAQCRATEQEVDILQKMYSRDETDADNGVEEMDFDTSLFDRHRIVIVGGHASWLSGMRDISKGITFTEHRMTVDDLLINAEVIWIQSNCISHSLFNKVLDIALTNKIPMRYFSYAGHVNCRNQLIRETREILGL